MSAREQKRVEREFLMFTRKNFEKPRKCKNLGQLQYYIGELSQLIEELNERFNYVPQRAYDLLTEYNRAQNSILYSEFRNEYGSRLFS